MAWKIRWQKGDSERSFALFRPQVVLWGDDRNRVMLEEPVEGWEWATLEQSPRERPVVRWHRSPEGVWLRRNNEVVYGPDDDLDQWDLEVGDRLCFDVDETVVEIASAAGDGAEITFVGCEGGGGVDEETGHRMWRLHCRIAEGDGSWTELLGALKEEAARRLKMGKVEGAGVLIWEGTDEFYDRVVWETEQGEGAEEGSRRPGALASLLTRDRRLQRALCRRGEVVIRRHGEAGSDVLLPIDDGEFLGAYYLVADDEGASSPEGGRELVELFNSLGVELIRRYHRDQMLRSVREENRYFRDRERRHYLLKDIVCESEAMRRVYDELHERVDGRDPILLTGEAGTGKELLARALHHLGDRREAMLIRMGCANFPEDLVDYELFGCVASELTGAVAARKGILELAEGGTVFLDEVDRLSPMVQGKLIRVVKEREVRRIGDAVGRPVDSRLVVSTHRDLEQLCEAGKFRRGLYEILTPHEMSVPPLRRRGEDVLPLARIFLNKFASRYDADCRRLGEELREWLTSYRWPGNVRQLQSFMEAAVLMQRGCEVLEKGPLAVSEVDGGAVEVEPD